MKLSMIALLVYSAATFAADYTCYRQGTKNYFASFNLTDGMAQMNKGFWNYAGPYNTRLGQCPSRVCGYIWYRGQVIGPTQHSRMDARMDDFLLYGLEGHGSLSGSVYFDGDPAQRVDIQCEEVIK